MRVDRKWVERNLGFDPIATPPPDATFASARAAKAETPEEFQREIIDFDSESPAGLQFMAFSTATGLSRYTDVEWPKGLAPKTGRAPARKSNSPLPRADVLLVTWTVDEGHALSRVLTPGKDSHNDYLSYTHNFAKISKKMRKGCPALQAKRLGAYWTTTIGGKSVVIFKSDSHMSQDGPQLPNIDVWRQIVLEVAPKLVITTGTAGGIGKQFEVGDVIVSPIVRFDCTPKFKKEPFAQAHFTSSAPKNDTLRQGTVAVQGERGAAPEGQPASPQDHPGAGEWPGLVRRHHRLLRLRYVERPLQAARARRRLRNGRRGPRLGCLRDGGERAAVAGDPERLRPADQGRRPHAQTTGDAGRADLQGFWPMELGLQRDHVLGQHRRGVDRLSNQTQQNVTQANRRSS
jgi:hypothetical protein